MHAMAAQRWGLGWARSASCLRINLEPCSTLPMALRRAACCATGGWPLEHQRLSHRLYRYSLCGSSASCGCRAVTCSVPVASAAATLAAQGQWPAARRAHQHGPQRCRQPRHDGRWPTPADRQHGGAQWWPGRDDHGSGEPRMGGSTAAAPKRLGIRLGGAAGSRDGDRQHHRTVALDPAPPHPGQGLCGDRQGHRSRRPIFSPGHPGGCAATGTPGLLPLIRSTRPGARAPPHLLEQMGRSGGHSAPSGFDDQLRASGCGQDGGDAGDAAARKRFEASWKAAAQLGAHRLPNGLPSRPPAVPFAPMPLPPPSTWLQLQCSVRVGDTDAHA